MADRRKTVDFFIKAFRYRIQTEFDINFADGSIAQCFALEPSETEKSKEFPWMISMGNSLQGSINYHMAPEIFVSDGSPDSIVGQWVAKRDGIGGIHHLAYQVDSVQAQMDEWRAKGISEFTTENPLVCPGLVQVFTKPSQLTGVIFEFIERGQHGFCKENVQQLMESTKDLNSTAKIKSDFPDSQIQPLEQ